MSILSAKNISFIIYTAVVKKGYNLENQSLFFTGYFLISCTKNNQILNKYIIE